MLASVAMTFPIFMLYILTGSHEKLTVIGVALYPIVTLTLCIVAIVFQKRLRSSEEITKQKDLLLKTVNNLYAAASLEELISILQSILYDYFNRENIVHVLDLNTNIFLDPFVFPEGDSPLLSKEERGLAFAVYADVIHSPRKGNTGFYCPIFSKNQVYGIIGIKNIPSLQDDEISFLQAIATQMGLILEYQSLYTNHANMILESEREKLRSNLLRSISHDLRTPLAGILGSASVLEDSRHQLDDATNRKLLSGIIEDCQWLMRMVENLLSVTTMQDANVALSKTTEVAEEIIGTAVSRIRKRFPNYEITVRTPEDILLVPMNPTLIEQVIINLIENAVKHGGADTHIHLNLKEVDAHAVFEIYDNGVGIAPKDLPHLFDGSLIHAEKSADSTRGFGLGLSLCMSIVEAHDGYMVASNNLDGGAIFRFMLPLREEKKHERQKNIAN